MDFFSDGLTQITLSAGWSIFLLPVELCQRGFQQAEFFSEVQTVLSCCFTRYHMFAKECFLIPLDKQRLRLYTTLDVLPYIKKVHEGPEMVGVREDLAHFE